jgi:hypothetical protein
LASRIHTTAAIGVFRSVIAARGSNSESAEAQLLLKQLAGIVAQNPPADAL